MPIRWTAETDQHLLITILKANPVPINYSEIASLWSMEGTKPTTKAISERISKIKKLNGIKSTPGTPSSSKPRARATVPKTPTKNPAKSSKLSPTKRKRGTGGPTDGYDSDDQDSDDEDTEISNEIIGVPVKDEADADADGDDDVKEVESPTKRAKGVNGVAVRVKTSGSPCPVQLDDEEEDIKTFSAFDDPLATEVSAEMW